MVRATGRESGLGWIRAEAAKVPEISVAVGSKGNVVPEQAVDAIGEAAAVSNEEAGNNSLTEDGIVEVFVGTAGDLAAAGSGGPVAAIAEESPEGPADSIHSPKFA